MITFAVLSVIMPNPCHYLIMTNLVQVIMPSHVQTVLSQLCSVCLNNHNEQSCLNDHNGQSCLNDHNGQSCLNGHNGQSSSNDTCALFSSDPCLSDYSYVLNVQICLNDHYIVLGV